MMVEKMMSRLGWRGLKVATAALMVALLTGVPAAFVAGQEVGSRGALAGKVLEESERASAVGEVGYDDELAAYLAAGAEKAWVVDAAVAAYSAEREAAGKEVPDGEGYAEGGVAPVPDERDVAEEARRMWRSEPPETEIAKERIEAIEAAERELKKAETELLAVKRS